MGNRAACPAADRGPSPPSRAGRPRSRAGKRDGSGAPTSVGESREAPAPYPFNRGSTLSAITWMASS